MPAIASQNSRVFNGVQFLNSFQTKNYIQWGTGITYNTGDVVYYLQNKYVASSTGTSGAIQPTHVSGKLSDGGVTWIFIETLNITSFFDNNLYIAIGKSSPWVDDNTPPVPLDSDIESQDMVASIISAKRITSGDVSLAIVRNNWSNGVVYSEYDNAIEDFNYATPFYVYTDENNIYKCINNNSGTASSSKPTGTSSGFTITADGYVWKYMASVSASDALLYLTSSYVPVRLLLADDGSPQWTTQTQAKELSLSSIEVTDGGAAATTANVSITAPDLASGVQATANSVIVGGVITSIQITNTGSGYTSAPTITFSAFDGTGTPTAIAKLAPKTGHGSNIILELNAKYALISSTFDDNESGYFPTNDDFRQLIIIVDPKDISGNLCNSSRYIGKSHPDYVANPNSLEKLNEFSGSILFAENVSPVVRASGQIENISVALKF